MITGCILSALLPQVSELRPTIGEASVDDCRDYWNAFARLEIGAAPLHCGTWFVSAEDIDWFRTESIRASAAAAQ